MPAATFEVVLGLLLLLGLFTRLTAILLAGFCIITGLVFHNDWGDPIQQAMFLFMSTSNRRDIPEDCGNQVDDDGDAKVDCADPECAPDPACTKNASPCPW